MFWLCFFLIASNSFGQVNSSNRLEIKVKDDYDNQDVLNFGDLGFAIRARLSGTSGSTAEWKVDFYNTDLELVSTAKTAIDKSMTLNETLKTKEQSYLAFVSKNGNYEILIIDGQNRSLKSIKGVFPKNVSITEMKLVGDYLILKARYKMSTSIFKINTQVANPKHTPINFEHF